MSGPSQLVLGNLQQVFAEGHAALCNGALCSSSDVVQLIANVLQW